jgi:geranylgeranyl pyrophosphate synthase
MQLNEQLKPYLKLIDREINNLTAYQDVPLFYDPIRYVLDLSGKKIRPLLVMLSCGVCGGDSEQARFAAAAVELLHNFTLVHDDIMDNDETRRGKTTVHIRWDVNTAILAGDGLLGFAFQKLLQTPGDNNALLAERFTEAMIIICEGQGLDKMFEQQQNVSADQYLDMIERKTAALLRMSCELGAIVAGAPDDQVKKMYDFGHNLGMGFQVQDDILDVMADPDQLGKKVGSDFEMHKQTILTIKLQQKIGNKSFSRLNLEDYRAELQKSGVLDEIRHMNAQYFNAAREALNSFPDSDARKILSELTDRIQKRTW